MQSQHKLTDKKNSEPPKLLTLHKNDNVSVLMFNCKANECINGIQISSPKSLSVGDKIATQNLAPGDQIIKYGYSIGTVTQLIKIGEWVHTHNLKSNYITHEL